ncbi:MAG: DEAD/DEAH box helicase [Candidatus Falkowbacteria bacterium]
MLNQKEQNHQDFANLGIKPQILAILAKMGLVTPTPIQAKAIPVAVKGKDLIGIAQTGTGKTLAFGVPLIQRLAEVGGKALVLLPTRELAAQVEESLKRIGNGLGFQTVSIIGGEAVGKQLFALRRNPRIIVATPGRLLDHVKRRTIKLNDVSVLVLDEADMMFDMGFAPTIEEIIKMTPTNRQTLLFSATMPAAIIRLAEKYLSSPLQIEVAPAGTTAELIEQEIYLVRSEDRFSTLEKILSEHKNLVLIFVRTKHGASNLAAKLQKAGFTATEIHSNLSFNQRKASLAAFKSGKQRILVATDVAARGLDINDIELVVNFDLPDNSEDYVHRIGRTARAGKGGKAISFALPNQRRDIQKIERLIKKNLPLKKIGEVQVDDRHNAMEEVRGYRGSQGHNMPRQARGARPAYGAKPQYRPKSAPDFSVLDPRDRRDATAFMKRRDERQERIKKAETAREFSTEIPAEGVAKKTFKKKSSSFREKSGAGFTKYKSRSQQSGNRFAR